METQTPTEWADQLASGCQRRALTESASGTRQRQAGKHGERRYEPGIGCCDWMGLGSFWGGGGLEEKPIVHQSGR